MKRLSLVLAAGLAIATASHAQEAYYSIFSYTHFIPEIRIDTNAVSLQEALYPDYYRTHSAARDLRWVAEHDSELVAFWQTQGDTVLHILTELSGLEWQEGAFDFHLVRYFPSIGSDRPLILPLGGIKSTALTEAAPTGKNLILNLIYQLSRRMLAQAALPADSLYHPISYHPLMRPGPYRRDNLAMLLAVAACRNIIGLDSTYAAFN
ncbi:MAG: hypothetical protein AB1744_08025, partial [Candidatus Zixiibacteriota bacterium]